MNAYDRKLTVKARLNVLATSDVHMHLSAYDYFADRPTETTGFVRTASLIRSAREKAAQKKITTLLFDCGDSFQGTPMADYLALDQPDASDNEPHPLIQCFDALNYDAATLGNHDFNYGLGFLNRVLSGAKVPYVCTNLGDNGSLPVQQTLMLERTVEGSDGNTYPIKIGLVGLLPPQTSKWDKIYLEGRVVIHDMVLAAERAAKQLRQDGADLVIALAHTGINAAEYAPMMENAALPLSRIPNIDILLTGHTHQLLPGPHHGGVPGVDPKNGTLNGKPALMTGWAGSHLGEIALNLRLSPDRGWMISAHHTMLYPIAVRSVSGIVQPTVKDDPAIADLIAPSHKRTLTHTNRPVGHTDVALQSFFALVAPSLSLQRVAEAQARTVRQHLSDEELGGLPILSASAPCKSGGLSGPYSFTDIPAGEIKLRHVADLHCFTNQVWAIQASGALITDWLEKSASVFHQIVPGVRDQPLLNPDVPSYHFDVVYGLKYQIDVSQPARFGPDNRVATDAHRIVNLTYQGKPVQPQDQFVLATTNYRANGGGSFPSSPARNIILRAPLAVQDRIMSHVEDGCPEVWSDPDPWSFVPMDGTSVVFETGPSAIVHLEEVSRFAPDVLGLTSDGFRKIRLHLDRVAP